MASAEISRQDMKNEFENGSGQLNATKTQKNPRNLTRIQNNNVLAYLLFSVCSFSWLRNVRHPWKETTRINSCTRIMKNYYRISSYFRYCHPGDSLCSSCWGYLVMLGDTICTVDGYYQYCRGIPSVLWIEHICNIVSATWISVLWRAAISTVDGYH